MLLELKIVLIIELSVLIDIIVVSILFGTCIIVVGTFSLIIVVVIGFVVGISVFVVGGIYLFWHSFVVVFK